MSARSCKLCQICMRFCIMFAVSGVVWSCDCWAWEIGDLASQIGPISDFGCVGRFAQFMRDCVGDLLFVVVLRRFIGNVVDSKVVFLCSMLFIELGFAHASEERQRVLQDIFACRHCHVVIAMSSLPCCFCHVVIATSSLPRRRCTCSRCAPELSRHCHAVAISIV